MKNLMKMCILTGLLTGVCTIAKAQRSYQGSPQQHRESRVAQHAERSTSFSGRSMPVRSFPNSSSGLSQRNNSVSVQRYSRPSAIYSNNRYVGPNYRYNNYHSSNIFHATYYRRPVFMYGPRYTVIPRNSISIYFGGIPYYYNRGYFYGYYGGYYQPLFPPFGLRIAILPFGYTRIFIGPDPYYYYNGIYYRQYDNSYEVVDAPMGATVYSLPAGAKKVILNGETLYELNGTYYKADRDSKGNEVFTVVGKNGEVNNSGGEPENPLQGSSLQIGDVISQLPSGSHIVTINGEKMYVTPDETYLKEETQNGAVEYRVVGK